MESERGDPGHAFGGDCETGLGAHELGVVAEDGGGMKALLSREDLVKSPERTRPHVVILGAGASKAAFGRGDANGRKVPLMNELPEVLGDPWRELVESANVAGVAFEAQFTRLHESATHRGHLDEIEGMLLDYFSSLALPEQPTIYDYLVLGLRPKDVIATFNWDPFLMLAHERNRAVVALPEIRFLHGCVRYASCPEHDVLGLPGEYCPMCRKALVESSMMFPHHEKDYARDGIIARDWAFVAERLKAAFHLTIFGYSGPATDYKAKGLLLDGWKRTPMRRFSHVEITDCGDTDDLRRNWREFIPFHHDMVERSFWESTIARWPRRTAEYKTAASLYGTVSERIGPIRTKSLRELQEWHAEIADAEKEPREQA